MNRDTRVFHLSGGLIVKTDFLLLRKEIMCHAEIRRESVELVQAGGCGHGTRPNSIRFFNLFLADPKGSLNGIAGMANVGSNVFTARATDATPLSA